MPPNKTDFSPEKEIIQDGDSDRFESPDRDISQGGYDSDDIMSDRSEEISQCDQIYTNKFLNLKKIKCFGFDMDYTLCEYISPQYDQLGFDLAKTSLVQRMGYNTRVLDLKYNPRFPVRGMWFDKQFGNLLKVDQFGKILDCIHGFRKVRGEELRQLYPHKIQRKDDHRVFVMNTLFNLAETHLLASIIDLFDRCDVLQKNEDGWLDSETNRQISYRQLFQDVRATIDFIHVESMELKKVTVKDLPRYVKKDERLGAMLSQFKKSGRKTLLLTNSDWWYTNIIMSYLLSDYSNQGEWLDYFDLTVVDGCKPRFFTKECELKEVDLKTSEVGPLKADHMNLNIERRRVFSGGDHNTLTKMLGVEEPEVLYCGDHLYGDVIKCRKECEWRTLLVVPELDHEVNVSVESETLLQELTKLETILSKDAQQFVHLKETLMNCVSKLDNGYGHSGSLFRAGSRLTYFGSQMLIWADVYTGSVINLCGYSVDHVFRPPLVLLPHETPADSILQPQISIDAQ